MKQKWWVLTSVGCGTFMATLDSSIVNVALPTLNKEFGPNLSHVKWVVMVYLLVITCVLLPCGRLSDEKGRKLVFQIGFFIFVLGSVLCGIAPELSWLILFRVVQGVGAAMLMANGPSLITSAFPVRERGAALGILAMVVSTGLVTGPSIGGFLISKMGWRSIFWVNLPVGVLGVSLVHYFVNDEKSNKKAGPFDWAGAFLQTAIVVLFMLLFDSPLQLSFSGWMVFIAWIGLVYGFLKVESRAKAPLFDLSLLKNQTFWTANLAGFLTFVAFQSVAVLMPFFLEEVCHFSPHKAGFFMTVIPLTIFVIAPMSGRASDRLGSQGLSFTGAFLAGIGFFSMAGLFGKGLYAQTSETSIVFGLCVMGLALGLFQSPNNNAIMGSVPIDKLGVASAMLATTRNLGLMAGTGLATSLFSWRMTETHSFVDSFHLSLFVAGVAAVGAMLASLGKRRSGRRLSRQKVSRHVEG